MDASAAPATAPGKADQDRADLPALPKLPLITAGLLLVAGILGAVSLVVPWGTFDGEFDTGGFGFGGGSFQFSGAYEAFSLELAGEEASYTDRDLDDADGIGKLRAAGPLLVVGMSLAFVGLVLVVLDLFVPQRHLDLAAGATAALGFAAGLAGTILLPLGIAESVTESFGGQVTAQFVAGLFLAATSALLALAGTTTGIVHVARTRMHDRLASNGMGTGA